jgi:hypothetical protein
MISETMNMKNIALVLILCALLTVAAAPAAASTVLTLGGDPNQVYKGINVGPYPATIDGTSGLLVFCLNEGLTANWGGQYLGTLHTPTGAQEEEAAFLGAYSLYQSPIHDAAYVDNVAGPVSMAIWQIMGELGSQPPDPKAAPYIQMAQAAFNDNLIPADFLTRVRVFSPDDSRIQPFMTAVRDDEMIANAAPEPGTWLFLVTGIGLICLGRLRSHG